MEEQIIRNIHENKENRPDSLEIGTPGKGGAVKITFNASHSAAETATRFRSKSATAGKTQAQRVTVPKTTKSY